MPISRSNADRCLQLLWEYGSHAQAPEQVQAYREVISSLHAYVTDVLPATLPCVRAQAQHGVVEIFPDQDARVQDVDLSVDEGEKLGIVLDCIDVNGASTASPIAITLLRPNCVAARDGRLARGDQVVSINGHSLSQVSLQRARWLLDSAERSHSVTLSIIASGLMAALKHSISRHDMLSLTPRGSYHSRLRHESTDSRRVKRLLGHKTEPVQKLKKASPKAPVKLPSRASLRAGYTPSIGSRHDSNYSVVSSTVEAAAFIARSSMRSSRNKVEVTLKKRKVRKMHIMKGTSGLGLRIIGGKGSKYGDVGIFVSQLEEGGAAFNDGRLHPGDELLMVDGKSLVGLSHDEAVGILKGTQKLVQLVVATEHIDEGESINSSLQSIPEMFATKMNLVRMVGAHTIAPESVAAIAPEVSLSPQRNAFQQSMEMRSMTGDALSPKRPMPPDSMETEIDDVDTRIVTLVRSEGEPLGLQIRQGYSESSGKRSIFVRAIDPNGVVGRSKQLHEGDELLKVNGISLEESTQQEAIALLTGVKEEMLTLHVANSHVSKEEKKEVLLQKISGRPLGIKLAATDVLTGNSNTMAVFIANIATGSPAHTSGKLSIGDRLVSVNDMSVLGMRVDQVKGLLSSIADAQIKLVVLSGQQPSSTCYDSAEKTTVGQNVESHSEADLDVQSHSESHSASDLNEEMEFTAAHPEVPLCPPPALEGISAEPLESISSSTVDADDDDSIDSPRNFMRIGQPRQSRPESSILDISGQPLLFAPSSTLPLHSNLTQSACSVSSSSPQSVHTPSPLTDSPSTLHLPPPPPSPPPELPPSLPPSPSTPSAQPPVGFISLQFKLKKRPRAGIGITLVASEGATTGLFMVRRIAVSGVAAKDGRIQIGDRLVSVNGATLFSLPHAAVLKALNEANKEVELVVWRDPNQALASSSTYSLGSYSNLSGSRSSLRSENEDGSPSSTGARKRYSRGLASPAARNSPLATRFSFAGVPSPIARDTVHDKRWSYGDVLASYVPTRLSQDDDLLPADKLAHTDTAGRPDVSLPPDVPNTTPPSEPPETLIPELPSTPPPNISIELLPELPSNLTPPESPPVPFFEASPSEPTPFRLSDTLPTEYPEAPPTLPPEPPIEASATEGEPQQEPPSQQDDSSPSSLDQQVDSRPPSLQVPRGARHENSPFEIELKKGLLGLGVSVSTNQMGMLSIKSLSARSVISQDGNIKVGDILLSINDDSMIGVSEERAETCLKRLPRGPFRLTVMAPPKDVTGEGVTSPPEIPPTAPPSSTSQPEVPSTAPPLSVQPENKVTEEESVISETLTGSSLGFQIEGGSDTPLKYVYIKSLDEDSPALKCGRFSKGDQLVMVGDTCLIGLTHTEATETLQAAPFTVDVVAQRKLSSGQLSASLSDRHKLSSQNSLSESDEDSKYRDQRRKADSTGPDNARATESIPETTKAIISVSSSEDLVEDESIEELPKIRNTDPNPKLRKANLIPEDNIIVDIDRAPGERLGIRIVGGTDNPNLKHVHVKQVVLDGAAARDGRIKTGDRIISVNDESLSGLSNKEALQKLKAAGDHVILKIVRKVGRRASTVTTPLASARHSRQGSGETSRAESRRMSPQRSPRATIRRGHGHGTGSSDEGSREGSRGPSPQHARRHNRRLSVSVQGEVLTFRDKASTLPRKIKGARDRVHLVELHKGPTGLGLQLQGSVDASTAISVKAVLRGGPAHKSDKIRVGDEIIEVNGISFENMSQQEALKTIKSLPQGKVSIILRDKPGFED